MASRVVAPGECIRPGLNGVQLTAITSILFSALTLRLLDQRCSKKSYHERDEQYSCHFLDDFLLFLHQRKLYRTFRWSAFIEPVRWLSKEEFALNKRSEPPYLEKMNPQNEFVKINFKINVVIINLQLISNLEVHFSFSGKFQNGMMSTNYPIKKIKFGLIPLHWSVIKGMSLL